MFLTVMHVLLYLSASCLLSLLSWQARATLKEPSRPVTPASLDARLDLIPGSSAYISGGGGGGGGGRSSGRSLTRANSGSRASSSSKVDNFLYSNKIGKKSTPSSTPSSSNSGEGYAKIKVKNSSASGSAAEHFTFDQQDYEEDNGDISYYDDSEQTENMTGINSAGHGDVGLLTMDIEDNVAVIETELRNMVLEPNMMTQLLDNMTSTIDKFTKYMKAIKFKQHKDLYDTLVDTLARILDATQIKSLRQQTCRHLLRLLLVKYPMRHVPPQDARILLRTARDLYLCASEESEGDIPPSSSDQVVSTPAPAGNDMMVQGGIDQILEFLSIVWVQVESVFKSKDGFHGDIDHSYVPVQEGEKLFGSVGAFKMFLEAGVYAAGIIRIYSTKETNRRRLCHIGAVAGLSDGLRTVLQILAAAKKEHEALKQEIAGGNSGALLANAAAKRDEAIALSQLGYIVVQITSTIRNFTLESNGRKELLSNSTVVAVCYLLNSFQNNAELLLNCVRVTAKLSQFEPFRVQLNKKPKYVSFLAKVIINEGEMCRRVMNGDTAVSWPSWHTWPLLSRAAFTLGNLTTNNDSNRLLIANVCKCLMPLIILLQTCSCSLMHLYAASETTGDSSEEDSEGDEEEEEAYDSDAAVEEEGKESQREGSQCTEFSTDKEPSKESGAAKTKGYVPTSFENSTEPDNNNEDDGCAESELNDATVKLLRLFANLTINETIGFLLAKRKDTSKMLLELLACSDSGSAGREELHLNVVAACTNLTFYSCRLENSPSSSSSAGSSPALSPQTVEDLQSLATRLANCLFHANKEVVLESARALGNLTRNEQVIESLCSNRAAEALVLLLDHSDFDVLIAVTGALVNISANVNSLTCLSESHQPAQSLALIMRKSSFKHLQLSTLVCQVFHNLLLHEKRGFDDIVRVALGDSLFELVDTAEDMINDSEDEEDSSEGASESRQRYEQFVQVGRMVLDFLTHDES
jgi:hypothetical protein